MEKNRRIVCKRLFSMLIVMCMLLTQEQMIAFAVENMETNGVTDSKTATVTSGTLGDNDGFKWTYDVDSKTLTVIGEDTGLKGGTFNSEYGLVVDASPFYVIANDVKKIIYKNCIFTGSIESLMGKLFSLEEVEFVNCDTSNVTDMSGMFSFCDKLTSLDVSSFDTSKVTDMAAMFSFCGGLANLDLSNFDTSNVTSMSSMFARCFNLEKINLSSFDTSKVERMSDMFDYCKNLKTLDLSRFNTSDVQDMSYMFNFCEKLKELDLRNFNTSNVSDMECMFAACGNLEKLDISKFDTSSVTNMSNMFDGCQGLINLNVSGFNTENVINMQCMFRGCCNLKNIDTSKFDTSNVTDFASMFDGCSKLESLNVSGFDTSNATNMYSMFQNCSSLKNIDEGEFKTSNVTGFHAMFFGCKNLVALDISNFQINEGPSKDHMFTWCEKLEKIYTPKKIGANVSIALPITFVDKNGNEVTEITSKQCNKVLTKIPHYTITYELNGGKNNSKNPTTYKKTSDTIVLKDATQKGYDFAGWYSDADFKTKVIKIEKGSTGNITLYAKWLPHKYNIKFNGNGADSGSVKTMSNRKYGTSYKLNANKFRKKGYTFTGWTTKKDGSGKTYKDKASVENLTSTDGKTITLYAQWKKTKYTITYVLGGNGKNNSKNPTSYYITSSTKELKKPKRDGYIFKGWYSDSKYKNKVTKIKKGSTGNKTFYAKWQAHKYNIVFDGNGATSGKMSKLKDRTYGKTYKLLANQFKKKGFTFIGWNTKADGTGKSYKDKESVKNLTSTNGKTVTLFAQWERTKYKIFYELYGGTNHSKNPEYYTSVSSQITLKSPKREGYQFVAWHTSDKFTKKNIVKTIEKGSQGNKQFYAEWKANTYNIVFDGNGADSGSMKKISNCKYDKSYTLPANVFSKTDYEFVGWNTKPEGNGYFCNDLASVKNLTVVNNGTVTLYAQWQETKQRAIWFMDELYITQVPGGDYSHAGTYNFDVVGYNGNRNIYAPFDCVIKKIHTGELYGNTVIIESVEKVLYADGTYDYMSMAFAHDNQISDLYVGKEIKQGEVFYQTGDYGYVTGVHCHVTCIRGKYQYDMWTKTAYGTYSSPNGIHPTKALFISDKTNVIDNKGLQFEIAP